MTEFQFFKILIRFHHVHPVIHSSAAQSITTFLQRRPGHTYCPGGNNALFCFNFAVVWTCNLSRGNQIPTLQIRSNNGIMLL